MLLLAVMDGYFCRNTVLSDSELAAAVSGQLVKLQRSLSGLPVRETALIESQVPFLVVWRARKDD